MATTGRSDRPGGQAVLGDRPVARIGFGAMQLEHADHDGAVRVLQAAIAHGVNHIDTAQFYGAGACNALIRDALAPYPDDLVLVSKVGAETGPDGKLVAAQRPEQLRAQIEANLASLGVERIAVVNLRRMDATPGLVATGDQIVPIEDQFAELAAMRIEGLIGGIGLSHVSAEQLRVAAPLGIVCVQNAHSVLTRTSEPVLDVCRTNGIAWVPFFPLGSAFAGWPKVTDDPTVRAVADRLDATPAQVGLAWELAHYERTLLIPGTSDPEHLEQNLAAGEVVLDQEAMAALDALG